MPSTDEEEDSDEREDLDAAADPEDNRDDGVGEAPPAAPLVFELEPKSVRRS